MVGQLLAPDVCAKLLSLLLADRDLLPGVDVGRPLVLRKQVVLVDRVFGIWEQTVVHNS